MTEYERYIEYLATLPDYKNLPQADKNAHWEEYKIKKQQESAAKVRDTLGVTTPNINLNTCSEDELMRLPRLSERARKNILKSRQLYSRGYECWSWVKKVDGVGKVAMDDIMTFCLDPATTPISYVPIPEDDLPPEP